MADKIVQLMDIVIDEQNDIVGSSIHQHEKSNLGLKLQGPAANGLTMENRQLYLCPKCHLVWFEELENSQWLQRKGIR